MTVRKCAVVYQRPRCSSSTAGEKMIGFQKIALKKGETREVSFNITEEDLKFNNNELLRIVEPGEFHVFNGGSSSDTRKASFILQ